MMADGAAGAAHHEAHHDTVVQVVVVVAVVLVLAVYLALVARRGGSTVWPAGRTRSFTAGSATLALAVAGAPGVTAAAQHVVTMMIAAPLITAGRPLRLALSALPSTPRRALRASVRGLGGSPLPPLLATALLPLEYVATMAVLFLTPLERLAEGSVAVHLAVHAFMLLCGLLFFGPVLGVPIAGAAPARRTRLTLAASAVPGIGVLGVALLCGVATPEGRASGLVLLVAGVPSAMAGWWAASRVRDQERPTPGEHTWPALSSRAGEEQG